MGHEIQFVLNNFRRKASVSEMLQDLSSRLAIKNKIVHDSVAFFNDIDSSQPHMNTITINEATITEAISKYFLWRACTWHKYLMSSSIPEQT